MNTILALLNRIYALLLRAYHSGFRSTYAAEMQSTFFEALEEAARHGWREMLNVFVRELRDLPGNLAQENWTRTPAHIGGPIPTQTRLVEPAPIPGTWQVALLAGIPHLLYALFIYLPVLPFTRSAWPEQLRLERFFFWLLVAGMLLFAWRRSWPRWSYSWMGYGLVFMVMLVTGFIPGGVFTTLAVFAWLAIVAFTLIWLAMRDWQGGLLAVLPITPMWVWWLGMENRPGSAAEGLLFISLGLLVSLAVLVIVRVGRWQTAVWLILAVILAAGLPISYGNSIFTHAGPPYRVPSNALNFANGVLVDYFVIFVFTAPLWLLALWRQSNRRRGPV